MIDPDVSEAEFLAREQADAKHSLADSIESMKDDLATAADPRVWARQHPWATLGAAVAAGFAVANALVPRQGEKIGDKLTRTMHAVRGEDGDGRASKADSDTPTAKSTLWPILMSALFDVAKLGVQMAIRQRAAARAPSPDSHPTAPDDVAR